MDKEKFPFYFLIPVLAYTILFLFLLMDFVFPAINMGYAHSELFFYLILFSSPFILLYFYWNDDKFKSLKDIRLLIRLVILGLILFASVFYMLLRISI